MAFTLKAASRLVSQPSTLVKAAQLMMVSGWWRRTKAMVAVRSVMSSSGTSVERTVAFFSRSGRGPRLLPPSFSCRCNSVPS